MSYLHILEEDFLFESKRFSDAKYQGAWLELEGNICKVRKGATDNGATFARDENAVYAWSFHDNAYKDKYCPLSRLQKDLIMYDLLKKEGFRWFRYKILGYKGMNMIWVYFVGVRLFGWIYHAK